MRGTIISEDRRFFYVSSRAIINGVVVAFIAAMPKDRGRFATTSEMLSRVVRFL